MSVWASGAGEGSACVQKLSRVYDTYFLVRILFTSTVRELVKRLVHVGLDWGIIGIGHGFNLPIDAVEDSTYSRWGLRELPMINTYYPIIVHLILRCLHRIENVILNWSGSAFVATVPLFGLLRSVLWRILILIYSKWVGTDWLKILIPCATILGILHRTLIDNGRAIWVVLMLLHDYWGARVTSDPSTGLSPLRPCCRAFNNWLSLAPISRNDILLELRWCGGEGLFVIASTHVPLHYYMRVKGCKLTNALLLDLVHVVVNKSPAAISGILRSLRPGTTVQNG